VGRAALRFPGTVAELPPEIFGEAAGEITAANGTGETRTSPFSVDAPPRMSENRTWKSERERLEREQLVRALAGANGNKAEAARALGIARSTLVSRLQKLGLS